MSSNILEFIPRQLHEPVEPVKVFNGVIDFSLPLCMSALVFQTCVSLIPTWGGGHLRAYSSRANASMCEHLLEQNVPAYDYKRASLLLIAILNFKSHMCVETFFPGTRCAWNFNFWIIWVIEDDTRMRINILKLNVSLISGYGRRLLFRRSRIWIPAPYTGWTFFTYICCKLWMFEKTIINEKEGRDAHFKKNKLVHFGAQYFCISCTQKT